MLIERATFVFAITIPFDIRDLMLDASSSTATLPGHFGLKRAKWMALGSLGVTTLAVLANTYLGAYGTGATAALLLSVGSSAALIWGATPERHDYYFSGLLDGTMVFQAVLVFLF